jgi:peptide deformylase
VALRVIRRGNDPVLRKKCHVVKEISPELLRLLDDMSETMYDADGVGLAAPQVGIAKKLVVIDTRESGLLELINPEIVEKSEDEENAIEGCLSFPGLYGEVPRSQNVKVAALNREGRKIFLKAEGLLSRALQHEIDHLNGILFVDRALRFVEPEEGGD